MMDFTVSIHGLHTVCRDRFLTFLLYSCFQGKAKWNAWNDVKGTSREDATQQYIALANSLIAND